MADGTQIRITALDQTQAAFRSVQGNINSLTGSLRGIAGPLAAAFSVAAIGSFSKAMMDAADRLNDVSEQTGIAVSELSALGNAAQLNGSNADTLNTALTKLNRSISEAAGGAEKQKQAFEAVGISADELANLSTTDIFFKISDAFAGAQNGANKTAIAMDLLGRSGAELIPVLNQGSNELKKYSATFSDDFAKASGEFNDNIDLLIINIKRIGSEALTPTIKEFNEFSKATRGFSETAKKEGFWRSLFGLTEIGEFLGYGVGDKVVAEIKKINEEQKKIPTPVGKKILPPVGKEVKESTNTLDQFKETLKKVDEATRSIETPTTKYYQALRDLKEIQDLLFPDEYMRRLEQIENDFANSQKAIELNDTALKKYSYSVRDVEQSLQNAAVGGLRSMEDALVGVYSGTLSVKDAFKNMATSIIQDLIRIQIQRSITGPLADALSGLFSAENGPIQLGGPRALGGTTQVGQAYMVGEKGPELFVPGKTGSIVPNNQLGGSGAVVNQTINISAGVSQTVRAEVMNMLPRIMEATKAAVADSKLRGGTYGKMLA